MKHHFGDELDRSGGHWTITPNRERWAHHYSSILEAPADVSVLTLTRHTAEWKRALTFERLTELTLHEPSREQLAAIPDFRSLKVLRLTHARPKSLAMLCAQQNLREIVFEYVSGTADLSPLGELPNLTALHVENMRNISDFSILARAAALRYLSLDGTPDWKQPVESFGFLGDMQTLEYLRLRNIRPPKDTNPLLALRRSQGIKKLDISMDVFSLEIFAWLEAALPGVEGAARVPFKKYGGEDRELHPRDIRSRMPLEQFSAYKDLYTTADGKRFERIPHQALLLGKGERHVSGRPEVVDERCEAHAERYRKLVEAAKLDLIKAQ